MFLPHPAPAAAQRAALAERLDYDGEELAVAPGARSHCLFVPPFQKYRYLIC
jgi:hypothetical protein